MERQPFEPNVREPIVYSVAIVCFFIGAFSVLQGIVQLTSYIVFLMDWVAPAVKDEWQKSLGEITQAPAYHLALSFYNIVVWNLVIILTVWLLRYLAWARKMLCAVLGFDMIVTVVILVVDVVYREVKISTPGWFISFNILQVAAIVTLSHPAIVEFIEDRHFLLKSQHKRDEIVDDKNGQP